MSTEASIQIGLLTISPAEQTPLVLALAEIIRGQDAKIKALRDEIHKLKGNTQRPKIEPSRLLKPEKPKSGKSKGKRPGSQKRRKTQQLQIHQDVALVIEGLPAGTQIEGYRDFVVQDLNVAARNTRYRRTVYRPPDGGLQSAALPADVNGHFGVGLKQFVLYQVHQTHVSQARLLEQLQEYGIDISAGQVNEILLHGHDALHAEKDALPPRAREVSGVLHTDDTSARHRGPTPRPERGLHAPRQRTVRLLSHDRQQIAAELPATALPGRRALYAQRRDALQLGNVGAPRKLQRRIESLDEAAFTGRDAFCKQLDRWRISSEKHRRLVCEAALYGALLTERWYDNLGLVSDDAPQFKLFGFVHGLCWVHAERKVSRLMPLTPKHKQAVEKVRDQIWKFYKRLQAYRVAPRQSQRRRLEAVFDRLFRRAHRQSRPERSVGVAVRQAGRAARPSHLISRVL